MSTSTWDTIVADFAQLMESDLKGQTHREYKHYVNSIDISKKSSVGSAVRDGSYSIIFNGQPKPAEWLNSQLTTVTQVRLMVGFAINNNSENKESYNNMVTDLMDIVIKRLSFTTWDGVFADIDHVATSPLIFIAATDAQSIGVVTLDFNVKMLEQLT